MNQEKQHFLFHRDFRGTFGSKSFPMHISSTYFCIGPNDSIGSWWRSSVSRVATSWTRQKRSSMPLRVQEAFLFIRAFKPALGSVQLISNGHSQHFSKGLGDYVVNLRSVKVKNGCSSTSTDRMSMA